MEKRKANLDKRAEEVQEILNSQYAEEYDQALKECKELAKNKNADQNKVAEVKKKLAEISSKMESLLLIFKQVLYIFFYGIFDKWKK